MKTRLGNLRTFAACVTVLAALITLPLTTHAAETSEKPETRVQAALEERTESFCSSVLPSWLASRGGLDDPAVRAVVTDCYVGKIRLAVLRRDGKLEGTTLSELPSSLLAKETGMSLDPYAPLAGRRIWSTDGNQE